MLRVQAARLGRRELYLHAEVKMTEEEDQFNALLNQQIRRCKHELKAGANHCVKCGAFMSAWLLVRNAPPPKLDLDEFCEYAKKDCEPKS